MYCSLFKTYVDDNHCNSCDTRTGYDRDTWKYTCDGVRQKHHPIVRKVRFWLKPYAFKMKAYIFIKVITNKLFGRDWYVWYSSRDGYHVGKMSWKQFMIVDGEQ